MVKKTHSPKDQQRFADILQHFGELHPEITDSSLVMPRTAHKPRQVEDDRVVFYTGAPRCMIGLAMLPASHYQRF
jgi:hypothetical protein